MSDTFFIKNMSDITPSDVQHKEREVIASITELSRVEERASLNISWRGYTRYWEVVCEADWTGPHYRKFVGANLGVLLRQAVEEKNRWQNENSET